MTVWELSAKNPERGAEVLVEEYGRRLYATAFRLCQNEKNAEDLVFRTFARVVERIGSFRGSSGFFTWMCAILVNFHHMGLRRKSSNALVFGAELPEHPDQRPNPFETLVANDEASILRAVVDALPVEQREAIVLHYFADMSVPEIAKAAEISDGTVYWRLHEGRRRIREAVAKVLQRDGI